MLGSYHFRRPHGVYWTPSPIFLHAEPCERFDGASIVPEIVLHRLVSVRTYDAEDMCIYELGDVCDGIDVERLLDRALADLRTDYANIHTARPGCFLSSGSERTPTSLLLVGQLGGANLQGCCGKTLLGRPDAV